MNIKKCIMSTVSLIAVACCGLQAASAATSTSRIPDLTNVRLSTTEDKLLNDDPNTVTFQAFNPEGLLSYSKADQTLTMYNCDLARMLNTGESRSQGSKITGWQRVRSMKRGPESVEYFPEIIQFGESTGTNTLRLFDKGSTVYENISSSNPMPCLVNGRRSNYNIQYPCVFSKVYIEDAVQVSSTATVDTRSIDNCIGVTSDNNYLSFDYYSGRFNALCKSTYPGYYYDKKIGNTSYSFYDRNNEVGLHYYYPNSQADYWKYGPHNYAAYSNMTHGKISKLYDCELGMGLYNKWEGNNNRDAWVYDDGSYNLRSWPESKEEPLDRRFPKYASGEMVIDSLMDGTAHAYYPYTYYSLNDCPVKEIVLNNCFIDSATFLSADTSWMRNTKITVNGGNFMGNPAFSSNTCVTVNRAHITDRGSQKSQYRLGAESYVDIAVDGSTTTQTVRLENPPIIIDWSEFPQVDQAAPTIEVIRDPVGTNVPTDKVTLTIKAKDPNGHDDPLPISINGGAFQASPATYTLTENGMVSIMARDANGNIREYVANVTNIDATAPDVLGFTQSTDSWTKDPVRITVNATDDVKLALAPYQWEFTPNSTGIANAPTDWVSPKYFKATENGSLRCRAKDATGKIGEWSEPHFIRNIDSIAPTATYELSPGADVEASKTAGVAVNLSLIDTPDAVTQESSGLSSTAVKWDSSSPWVTDTQKVFHENGIYSIKVRDAVGNVSKDIPITISNISSTAPVIDSFTGNHTLADFVTAPVTLEVKAHSGNAKPLPDKPYSWDGGNTWTSVNSFKAYNNGEYTIKVRDATGTIAEASLVISNIDSVKPTASVYLFKGPPADGTGKGPDDYVWKLRVEADDIGSGVEQIETLWDGGTHTSLPIIQEVAEAGIYGIIVHDKAGNETYAEKIVTAESIGGSAGGGSGNGEYVEVQVPPSGSASSTFNASLGDLIFGKTGAYNKVTKAFTPYPSGEQGIEVNLVATAKRGSWLTGEVSFSGVKYPIKFEGAEGIAGGKNIAGKAFIPIAGLTSDVKNAKIKVVFKEWDDSTKAKLEREGSATLYTSVQVSVPTLQYTYSRATDLLTVMSTSAVAGIKGTAYALDSGTSVPYTVPFLVGSAKKINIGAEDNVGNRVELVLDVASMELNGGGGGTLPTEGLNPDSSTNVFYSSNRSAEIYIIGGSKSNTSSVPSGSVFETILDTGTP